MACRFGAKCIAAMHEHLHTNGAETHCQCGQPCYYDLLLGDYQHSAADAPDCHLIAAQPQRTKR
jgi:hypothetical protein